MDSVKAFEKGKAARAAGAKLMVFDWHKAAKLIRERQPKVASAGLKNDWEWTGGTIYSEGEIVTDSYTYLASLWAIPELDLDGEIIECYVMQDESPGWDSGTKWPDSAKEILHGLDDLVF